MLRVHLAQDTLAVNDTGSASVSGFDQFGQKFPLNDVTWDSQNPLVATVNASGHLLSASRGPVGITATANGLSDTAILVVAGTLHTRPITASESWSLAASPHFVRGRIAVGAPAGVVLTFEQGIAIKLSWDAGLDFGVAGPARLVADGGTTGITLFPVGGVGMFWAGLTFQGPGQSALRNVKMWGCGGLIYQTQRACLVLNDAGGGPPTLLVDSVAIYNSVTSAVSLEGRARFAAGSRKLSVYNIDGSVATMPLAAAPTFPVGGEIDGNRDNTIHLSGDTILESITLPKVGAGWYFAKTLVVAGRSGPILTVPDSSRLVFALDAGLVVGQGAPGGIQIGVPGGSTTLIESADSYGWRGLQLWSAALPSSISRTVFRTCFWCVYVNGEGRATPELLVDNLVTEHADGAGVLLIEGARFASGSRVVQITGTTGVPMYVSPGAIHTIPSGAYTGNQYDAIRLWGSEVKESETWPNLGVPYATGLELVIEGVGNPMLTLAPGVVLRTLQTGRIRVGVLAPGGLRAIGTADAPVRLTGEVIPPSPGFWRGLYIGAHADSGTLLDHATVEDAGGFDGVLGAAVHIEQDLGEIVKNTVIRRSAGCGIARASGTTWTTDFTSPQLANQFEETAGAAQCGP
jgi:hypothetical protein